MESTTGGDRIRYRFDLNDGGGSESGAQTVRDIALKLPAIAIASLIVDTRLFLQQLPVETSKIFRHVALRRSIFAKDLK